MLLGVLRWLHVVGAAVLLGTGAGIAFFMLVSHRSRKPSLVAHTAGIVVMADFVFTASAVLVQPVTGFLLAHIAGWPLTRGWIELSLVLYVVTGICWLPVVWIQVRMRDLAREADMRGQQLPAEYHRLFSAWVILGVPAFLSVLTIVWLMVTKPALG